MNQQLLRKLGGPNSLGHTVCTEFKWFFKHLLISSIAENFGLECYFGSQQMNTSIVQYTVQYGKI